jgi:cell division protein FtsB
MRLKITVYSLVLCAELMVVTYFSIGGSHGIRAVHALEKECRVVRQSCAMMQQEVTGLRDEIGDWHKYPFYRELHARHKLQMARPREELYRYE